MIYFTNKTGGGLGNCIQQIISLLSFAKKNNIEFVYNPISKIHHIDDEKYIKLVEDYFQIKNNFKNVNDIVFDKIINTDDTFSLSMINDYNYIDENILFYINHVYFLIDPVFRENKKDLLLTEELWNEIKTYDYGMNILKNIKKRIDLPYYNIEKTNIAIHIRRGDVSKYTNTDRYIPFDNYYNIIENLNLKYNNACFFIFSEITNDKHEFDEFINNNINKGIDINLLADIDILTTLEYMIKADVFVMSKSSLSYVAALYNVNKVLYIDFWHTKMPYWETITNLLNII
jgi:hypothetical protein